MACSVTYNPETDLIETVYSELVTAEDVTYAATERIRLQREEGASWQVLIDAGQIRTLQAGIYDLYRLPEQVYPEEQSDPRTQIALVLPSEPNAREGAMFFETACVNRGWLVKSFDDDQAATAWLTRLKQKADDHPR